MAIVFSQSAAKRIVAATKKIEGLKPGKSDQRPSAGTPENDCFGFISGCDVSGHRFSFVRVVPDASSDTPDLLTEGGLKFNFIDTGTLHLFTAYELNSTLNIPTGAIVKMSFTGYNSDGDAVFVFQYQPQIPGQGSQLPIHDHRSNDAGGFAFAVYHPGSQLPAQPWAI